MAAEKDGPLKESPRVTSAARRQTSLRGMIPAIETKEPGPPGEKWRKIHWTLDAGGGARCYNRGYCEPGSVPGTVRMGNVGEKKFQGAPPSKSLRQTSTEGTLVKPYLAIPLLVFATVLGRAASTQGGLIDTFSDGTVVNQSAPPTQFMSQSGLSGVIGAGERKLEWGKATLTSPGPESLDLNNLVPGSVVLSVGPGSVGFWAFYYGNPTPLDMDLTDAGASNAFGVEFTHADAGTLLVEVTDTSNNNNTQTIPFSPLPSGGLVSILFGAFSPIIDFQHIKNLAVEIDGVTDGSYEMQVFDTQFVPEPSSLALAALGLMAALLGLIRRTAR